MRYSFTDEQHELIKRLGFNPDQEYDEDAAEALLDAVADCLMDDGFDKDYKPNPIGDICENIITILTRQ